MTDSHWNKWPLLWLSPSGLPAGDRQLAAPEPGAGDAGSCQPSGGPEDWPGRAALPLPPRFVRAGCGQRLRRCSLSCHVASCSQEKARHRLGTCGNPQNLALSWDIRLFVWPRVVAVGVLVAVGSTGSPPRQVMGQPRGTPPGSGDRGAVGGGGGDGPGHLHAGCSLHPLTGRSRGLFLLLALARPSVCCPQTPLIPLRGRTAPYFCWHDTQVASRTTFLGASRGFHKPRVLHKTPMVWPDEAHQGPSTAQGLLTKAQLASLWVTHHGP